jgi:hypothetical protein
MPITFDKIRVALRCGVKRCSSVWVGTSQKGNFYFGVRGQTGQIKISLHESGQCHIAFGEQYWRDLQASGLAPTGSRFSVRWKRRPTPSSGSVHALSIFFPTDFARLRQPIEKTSKRILWIEPAGPSHAVELGIFFSNGAAETLETKFLRIGTPICYARLPSGELVSMIGRQLPFDPQGVPDLNAGKIQILNEQLAPKPGEQCHDLSAFLWNQPKDDEALQIVELSGLSLQRSVSK